MLIMVVRNLVASVADHIERALRNNGQFEVEGLDAGEEEMKELKHGSTSLIDVLILLGYHFNNGR